VVNVLTETRLQFPLFIDSQSSAEVDREMIEVCRTIHEGRFLDPDVLVLSAMVVRAADPEGRRDRALEVAAQIPRHITTTTDERNLEQTGWKRLPKRAIPYIQEKILHESGNNVIPSSDSPIHILKPMNSLGDKLSFVRADVEVRSIGIQLDPVLLDPVLPLARSDNEDALKFVRRFLPLEAVFISHTEMARGFFSDTDERRQGHFRSAGGTLAEMQIAMDRAEELSVSDRAALFILKGLDVNKLAVYLNDRRSIRQGFDREFALGPRLERRARQGVGDFLDDLRIRGQDLVKI